MVELVAERGYDAVTVRGLARLACVSTRTFYQHYSSKGDCFLGTHDLIVRRLLRHLASAQTGVHDWHSRVQLALHAFLSELAGDPRAARVLLVEAYAAGPAALEQAQRASRMFGSRISESFDKAPDEIMVPPLVIEGIVAGLASVVRARLLAGRVEELNGLNGRLLDWALAYCSEGAAVLAEITYASAPPTLEASLRPVPSSNARQEEDCVAGRPTGDFALLLSAAAKLAASDGAGSLTVPRVLSAAGVGRRSFYAHFGSLDDCLTAALDLQVDQAIARAKSASASSSTWAGGACRAIVTLRSEIVGNRMLVDACAGWPVGTGTSGVRCRERLTLEVARLLTDGAPPAGRTDDLTAEAAAGAVLAVLPPQAYDGIVRQALHASATLTYLALAPVIGADQAVRIIWDEYAVPVKE
jgi:AcrR family transcriptional regulator